MYVVNIFLMHGILMPSKTSSYFPNTKIDHNCFPFDQKKHTVIRDMLKINID